MKFYKVNITRAKKKNKAKQSKNMNDIVLQLAPFMVKNKPPPQPQQRKTKEIFIQPASAVAAPPPTPRYFFDNDKQIDTLGWCCYILSSGMDKYELYKRTQQTLVDFKIEILDRMQTDPPKIRKTNQKVTNVIIQNLKTNLVLFNTKMGISELIAFCAYYDKHVKLVFRKNNEYNTKWEDVYLDIYTDETQPYSVIVYYMDENTFEIIHETNDFVFEKKYCINQYNKYLGGVSTYKTEELQNIANKLQCNISEFPKDKKKIHEKLYCYISEIVKNAIVRD